MADILLEVGINLASLKTARAQIGAELKSWKFPETEKVMPIDAKQLSDSKKFAGELRKEFEKLGTAIGKGDIVNISKAYAPLEEIGKAAGFSSANLRKLAETSKFYNLQAQTQGESLALVRAELSAYNRALADGSVSMQQVGRRYTELSVKFNEFSEQEHKARSGLLAGLDPKRLLLWAVGWQFLYGILRGGINVIQETISNIVAVNEALATVRIANDETAQSFSASYQVIRKTIYDVAIGSELSAKQIAQAYKTLSFEGANTSLALVSLVNVKNLMTITGEKENIVAQALIETYGIFKDKLSIVGTESEKVAKVTDLLAALFTKAHVSLAEYQQIMGYIAPTAAQSVESFESLVGMLIFADQQMLGGRRSGMALIEVLMGLTENAQKLKDIFGIIFKPDEIVTVEVILKRIQEITKNMSEPAKRDLLGKIFKGAPLELIIKLLAEADITLKNLVSRFEDLSKKEAKATEEAKYLQIAFKDLGDVIASAFSGGLEALSRFASKFDDWYKKYEQREQTRLAQATGGIFNPEVLINAGREQAELFKKGIEQARVELPKPARRILPSQIEILGATRAELLALERSVQLRELEASGASLTYLTQEKINDAIYRATDAITDEKEKQEAINALYNARNLSVEELFKVTKAIGFEDKEAQETVKAIVEARSEIQLKMYEEIKSLADEIESKTVDFVKNMMTGTANAKDFFQSIVDVYRETFATNIVKIFGEQTGIFSGMAAAFMGPLQRAHYTGIQTAVPLIVQAHIDGIRAGMTGTTTAGKEKGVLGALSGSVGVMTGFMKNVSNIFKFQKAPPAAGTAEALKGLPAAGQQQGSLQAATKAVGQAVGAAAAVYGGYQGIMAQKGQGAGMGALGGMLSGAMVGSMFGPIGTVVGGIVGAIGGAIMGGKKAKAPDPQITQQTIEIKSAIQVSNRELSLVNRNLEGIKRVFEGYWMPRSAFFSERLGIEERFNLDRQRGL